MAWSHKLLRSATSATPRWVLGYAPVHRRRPTASSLSASWAFTHPGPSPTPDHHHQHHTNKSARTLVLPWAWHLPLPTLVTGTDRRTVSDGICKDSIALHIVHHLHPNNFFWYFAVHHRRNSKPPLLANGVQWYGIPDRCIGGECVGGGQVEVATHRTTHRALGSNAARAPHCTNCTAKQTYTSILHVRV